MENPHLKFGFRHVNDLMFLVVILFPWLIRKNSEADILYLNE